MATKILIIYDTKTGNTQRLAEAIYEGANLIKDVEVDLKRVQEVKNSDLEGADGIIIGSPTYFGSMTADIKAMLDKSVAIRGRLEGKVGGAFATSGHPSGGKETTIISILEAMLIHGMVIVGDPIVAGGHYGIATKGAPMEEEIRAAKEFGRRVAEVAKKLR